MPRQPASSSSSSAAAAATLPLGFLALFVAAALVGDNGEQILDTATNYKIDAELAGGRSSAFLAKSSVNEVAASTR